MGFIIVVLIVLAILCGIVMFSKSQANGILDGIRSTHKIDLSFSTSSGCLAFSDSEKNIHFYSTTTHEQVAINYDSITSCGKLDESSNLILFNALNPKLTQYKFGAQNIDRTNEILKKMNSILLKVRSLLRIPFRVLCLPFLRLSPQEKKKKKRKLMKLNF